MNIKQSIDIWQLISIIAFAILSALVHYLPTIDLSLETISDGIFSEATFNAIDIKARKNLIWKFLFFASIISFALHFLWSKLKAFEKFDFFREGLSFLSFVGICIYWIQIMGIEIGHAENLLYSSFIALPFYSFINSRNKVQDNLIASTFSSFLLASLALSFLFVLLLPKGDFLSENFIYAAVLLFILLFALTKLPLKMNELFTKLSVLIYTIPLWYFLALEWLVIGKTNGGLRPIIILFSIAMILSALLLYSTWRKKSSQQKYLLGILMVASLACLAYYEFSITNPIDEFEMANRANAMMRFFKFGEIPFVDYLSSHNLFDHLWPFLYTFVNGYTDNVSFLSYGFARHAVTAVGGFLLLNYLFRNWALAALFIIVLPFNRALFPMAMALIMPILLSRSYNDFSSNKLIWIPIWTIFLVLWKMDVGFGNLVAVTGSLAIYFYHFGSKEKLSRLASSVKYPIAFLLSLFVVFGIFKGFPYLFKNISQALGYFSGDQAHGLSALTLNAKDKLFFMHYFAFPTLVFLILIYLLFNFRKIFAERQNIIISLIYLSIFYFANFQRGLVRHSFLSGSDAFLSSYVFLIFGLFATLFVAKRYQWVIFTIVSIFFIHNFRFAEAKGLQSLYEKNSVLVKSLPAYQIKNTQYHEDRMVSPNKPYAALKQFFDNELSGEQSFIDFTNTPMTYFYTQRKVPSYFNQYLQNTVTRKLQLQNIESLDFKNTPFVLFRNKNLQWGDMTDGVHNALRYIELTQYIYQQYKPYKVIDGKELWVHNDFVPKESADKLMPSQHGKNLGTYYLGHLPNYSEKGRVLSNSINLEKDEYYFFPTSSPDAWQHNYLKIEFDKPFKALGATVKIYYPEDDYAEAEKTEISFAKPLNSEATTFEIPLSWSYKYYLNRDNLQNVKFGITPSKGIEKVSIIEATFD